MGDRRNVVVEFENGTSVALYTHWTGSDLPQTLAKALDRGRSRWDDPAYLTRIIFSEMIAAEAGDDVVAVLMGETGFGIEPIPAGSDAYCESDPGYDLTLSFADKQVYDGDGTTYSFEGYVKAYRK